MLTPWPSLNQLFSRLTVPEGLQPDFLREDELDVFVENLKVWYPDIVVGSESCHLSVAFYKNDCALGPIPDSNKMLLPLVLRRNGNIVWFINFEKEVRGQTLTARMGAISPTERGAGLAMLGPQALEQCARNMNFGLAYYFATLKIPHQQVCAEKCGFKLVGIVPGYDIDMVRPNEPRRVFEALYAKVLVEPSQCEIPASKNLTPKTKALYDFIFSTEPPSAP